MVDQSVQIEEERLSLLSRSVLGSALSEEVLRDMATTEQPIVHSRRYERGQAILRQGDPGSHFHILVSGRAEVRVNLSRGGVVTVASFREGDCFGEMSLLTGDPVSADVVAADDSETLALDREGFNALVSAHPNLLREFVRMISNRLRSTDVAVGAAQEKEQELTRFLREARSERYGELVGKQFGAKELQRRIEEQAQLDMPLLIQGERGTGKELIARLIHYRGPRKEGPLFCTDCAQMSETKWGDPLFGDYHRKQEGRPHPRGICYIDLAEGGTILLKNIDAMPRAVQERLARFLERESWEPGAPRRHDARVIATCRGSLTDAARVGQVSPALVKVLSERAVTVPPLREHKRDIPELATHFMRKHAQRLNKKVDSLADQALTRLVSYNYRIANVQELEETIERAVILTDDEIVDAEEIFLGHPPDTRPRGFNLLKLPKPFVNTMLRVLPKGLQGMVAIFFAFVLYQCFFAPAREGENLGTLLVWSVWWPMLVLSFFFLGRVWCAVCPMSLAGATAQRVRNLERRIPGWLKDHDAHVVMAGFFAIVWVEEITGMRHAPRATGFLLLFILGGALIASILFPRRTWCRHLCPLGGFAGLCSTSAIVELRPTLDICAAKCKGHSCYKGDEGIPGCPMFNHVMFTESNQHCVLCMNCVRSCPNGSPQLNVRIPARELWTTLGARPEMGRFVAMLAGLLVAQTLIQQWEGQPDGPLSSLLGGRRSVFLSGLLALSAGVPLLGLWLATRRQGQSPDPATPERFWQKVLAWLPMVTAGFVCYQLGFMPGLQGLRAALTFEPHAGSAVRSMSVSVLDVVRFGILSAGLVTTIIILWKHWQATKEDGGKGWIRKQAVSLAGTIAYWGLFLWLMLRPEWMNI